MFGSISEFAISVISENHLVESATHSTYPISIFVFINCPKIITTQAVRGFSVGSVFEHTHYLAFGIELQSV